MYAVLSDLLLGNLHTAPWPLGKVSVGKGTCPIIKQNDACEERAQPLENTLNKSDSRCFLGSVPHGGRHIRNSELPKCAYQSTVLELEIKDRTGFLLLKDKSNSNIARVEVGPPQRSPALLRASISYL